MALSVAAEPVPFALDEQGSARVGGTRVTLTVLLGLYGQGMTAEQLHDDFPTVALADIHATIAYYLRHRAEVDAYLAEQEWIADKIRAGYEDPEEKRASAAELYRRAEANGLAAAIREVRPWYGPKTKP